MLCAPKTCHPTRLVFWNNHDMTPVELGSVRKENDYRTKEGAEIRTE